jgi:hypothetical protein
MVQLEVQVRPAILLVAQARSWARAVARVRRGILALVLVRLVRQLVLLEPAWRVLAGTVEMPVPAVWQPVAQALRRVRAEARARRVSAVLVRLVRQLALLEPAWRVLADLRLVTGSSAVQISIASSSACSRPASTIRQRVVQPVRLDLPVSVAMRVLRGVRVKLVRLERLALVEARLIHAKESGLERLAAMRIIRRVSSAAG